MNKVAVYGGLGNQMFQHAFCTALNSCGQKARISFTGYFYYKHHNGFDLYRAFYLKLSPLHKLMAFMLEHAPIIWQNKISKGIAIRFAAWYEGRQKRYNEPKEFILDEGVFKMDETLFYGTWQCLKYFEQCADAVRKQFVFKEPVDDANKTVIEKIKTSNAVSIHIRRGDYLSNHWQSSVHVIKDVSYYKRAIKLVEEKVAAPTYFIFSDDLQWVKENLQLDNCIYVEHNTGKNSFIDMYLMSLCKHNIIANSSFSWWGAWLNSNSSKIVIMPQKWMNNNTCEGIFPDEWIKLPV